MIFKKFKNRSMTESFVLFLGTIPIAIKLWASEKNQSWRGSNFFLRPIGRAWKIRRLLEVWGRNLQRLKSWRFFHKNNAFLGIFRGSRSNYLFLVQQKNELSKTK